jgi:maltose alpha-D-glucosyltransferase / alpha-amylase
MRAEETGGEPSAAPPGHWFQADPLWFKRAVFYEIHLRAFYDGNGDGSGDLRGLTEKLEYLKWLGIDCIWLLPMYPSPLKDGGYDVADFLSVHPDYGVIEDFRRFVDQAHQLGIRVIADFVMNHTSSDHPWFEESRSSPDSPKRDWYVWSDTDKRYEGARIIFTDTEISNWTWDPVAGAYYWHRFFHHQPDLNYENQEMQRAMLDALRFWLDLGLDGFRLDAVPYLYEQDGTNCENLPATHAFLRKVRAHLDESHPDTVLLAEANQWPADVVEYFGDGDECHMAFHFPVMPRMFMALRREEAKPIYEILAQTPEIPGNCQWGLFLRNHDELTLEMVADEERDYMYAEYAKDPRMRINVGIRRRLAPLLDNGRDEIELVHAILFSLPGSPVLYYGDEIGMGDNVHLSDRDGVRTPMHWTGDRNAGFSRADFAQLYLPPLMDPVTGYQAVNVEAQLRSPTSLLRWLHRFIALRKEHPVFGLGTYEPLAPDNSRIFAHVRRYEEDIVLCVHNLARSAQAVTLDLSEFDGLVPEELLGGAAFPAVTRERYLLTLGPRGFYWFTLRRPDA